MPEVTPESIETANENTCPKPIFIKATNGEKKAQFLIDELICRKIHQFPRSYTQKFPLTGEPLVDQLLLRLNNLRPHFNALIITPSFSRRQTNITIQSREKPGKNGKDGIQDWDNIFK